MTFAELRAVWDERDHRYSVSLTMVSLDEERLIRAWRTAEADGVTDYRETARRTAGRWQPPARL